MAKKIQVGYGSGRRGSSKTNLYGGKQSGKVKMNGGFNHAIAISYEKISDERWEQIFGKKDVKGADKKENECQ